MKDRQSFFNSRALFWGFGLSNILRAADTGFWISIILGTIVGLSFILIVKNKEKLKILKVFSGFILAFLSSIILINMGSTLYLRNTPVKLLALSAIAGAFVISMVKPVAFKKALHYIYIISIIFIALETLLLIPQIKLDNLRPISYSLKGILKGTWIFVLASATPILALDDLKDKKTVIKNYLISSLSILIIAFLTVTVMGNKEAMLYRYPEYIVLKRIRIYEFFSNVENLFVGALVADLLLTMASGFRNIDIKGKYTKYIVPLFMICLVSYTCSSNGIMTMFYQIFPLILIVILFLTLIPKK